MEEVAKYNTMMEVSNVAAKPNHKAMVAVESDRAIAEVQGAIILAKRFPRDQKAAMDRIEIACQRPGLAEQALYSYARGGTEITGPSIRLAEALAQNWGNLTFGIRELEQRNGESTVEAFAWDMETNVRQVKIFQVKHERFTRKGSYKLEDPRDIYELVANNGARRLRACILGVIPGDVVDAAVSQCEATLKASADTSPEALKKMVDVFVSYGVTKAQLEKRIQRRLESITAAQLISLRKVCNSLRDGMSTVADWFEVDQQVADAPPEQTLKEKLKKRQQPANTCEVVVEPNDNKKEELVFAPAPCPDKPGNTYTIEHCAKCANRIGCPVFD